MSIRTIQDPINVQQLENVNYNFGLLFNYLMAISGGNDISQLLADVAQATADANNATANADDAILRVENELDVLEDEIVKVENLKGIGDWNATTLYKQNNIVAFLGNSYLALQDNINVEPPNANSWLMVSQRGETGKGLTIVGTLADPSLLPPAANYNEGDAFYVGQNLYVKISNNWVDVGQIKGDKGDPGTDANVTSANIISALGYTPYSTADNTAFMNNEFNPLKTNANNHFVKVASNTELGHVKVGSGLAIDSNGVLSTKPLKDVYFYYRGFENAQMTGGWVAGYSVGNGNIQKQSGDLLLTTSNNPTQRAQRTYVTNNSFLIDDFKTIYVDWENTLATGYSCASIAVDKNSDITGRVAFTEHYNTVLTRQVSSFDVSNLSGQYYLRVQAYDSSASVERDNNLKVYAVWGEY